MNDGWSRKQYAALETRQDEAADILEELWQEETTVFSNWPMHEQRSESGEAEEIRRGRADFVEKLRNRIGKEILIRLRTVSNNNMSTDHYKATIFLKSSRSVIFGDFFKAICRPLPLLDQLSR